MKRAVFFFVLGSFLLAACSFLPRRGVFPAQTMNPDYGWWGNRDFDSNGERIYFTATNERGEVISYTGGRSFGGMMMGNNYLTCASCHGQDGRGGTHTMHMSLMDAPDIRYSALKAEEESNGEDEHGDDDHAVEHSQYDLEAFRRAVVEGQHPDGDALDGDMPRWNISDEDLGDLFEYLKSK